MEEIGLRLLKAVGMEEEDITPEMIEAAIAANNTFHARLEEIRNDGMMRAAGEPEGELN